MFRGCSRIFILGELRTDNNLDGRENRARYFAED